MNRNERYFDLSTKLSFIDTATLCRMLDEGNLNKEGWGTNHTINVGHTKVFAKKIPLTQIEFDHPFHTKNHYNLPMDYNYGIGSAGFGAFRELLLHIKTTHWVLNNDCQNFPLMYHYRILKREDHSELNLLKHEKYIEHWNNDKNISQYIQDRNTSPYEIVLFLEFIPTTFKDYLIENKTGVDKPTHEILRTIDFLKSKQVIHFDMHFHNILIDDQRPYLTDFGLGLDLGFEFSAIEEVFFERHINYDYCEFIGCFGFQLASEFEALTKERKTQAAKIIGLQADDDNVSKQRKIIASMLALKEEGYFNLTKSYIDLITKHERTILLSTKFFMEARDSRDRGQLFSKERFEKSLSESGLI